MYPILFSFGPVTIYAFGFFIGLAFFLFSFIAFRRLKELGLKEESIFDLLILSSIAGSLGIWLLLALESFAFKTTSFWAGLTPFLLTAFYFGKKNKWDFWAVFDELAFAICPFAILFYLGLFLDGSLVGSPTAMPWGIFPPGSLVKSHPVAVFAMVAYLLIWLILLRIERDWRTWRWYKSKRKGFIFFTFLLLALLTSLSLAFLTLNDLYYLLIKTVLAVGALIAAVIYFLVHGQIIWLKKSKRNKKKLIKT